MRTVTKEKELKEYFKDTVAYALKKGADECEIYYRRAESDMTQMRNGELSDDRTSDARGYSVRLIRGGVPGFSYGVAAERDALRRCVDNALLSCDFLDKDEDYHFTPPGQVYPEVEIPPAENVGFNEKTRFLKEIGDAAMAEKNIRNVERASFSSYRERTLIMNSLGLDLGKEARFVSAAAAVVAAGDEEEQIGGEWQAAPLSKDIDFAAIGRKAAADGKENLGAAAMKSGEYPVLFRPEAVLSLLALVMPSLLGDNVEKGLSRLGEKLGEAVAAAGIFLTDDALAEEFPFQTAFDDEGQPCRRNLLLEDGVLRGFLYDNRYGRRARKQSTGNGVCGSHKGLPSVSPHGYMLKEGTLAPDEVMISLEHGVRVKELMGLHMADPVSGDFSLGIVGHEICRGEVGKSVRGNMIAGNLFTLLRDVEAVCNDLTVVGDTSSPSLLIKSLKISGK